MPYARSCQTGLLLLLVTFVPAACEESGSSGASSKTGGGAAEARLHRFKITHLGVTDIKQARDLAIVVPGDWSKQPKGPDRMVFCPANQPARSKLEIGITTFPCGEEDGGEAGCVRKMSHRHFGKEKIASGIVKRSIGPGGGAWFEEGDASKGKRVVGWLFVPSVSHGAVIQCQYVAVGDRISTHRMALKVACESLRFVGDQKKATRPAPRRVTSIRHEDWPCRGDYDRRADGSIDGHLEFVYSRRRKCHVPPDQVIVGCPDEIRSIMDGKLNRRWRFYYDKTGHLVRAQILKPGKTIAARFTYNPQGTVTMVVVDLDNDGTIDRRGYYRWTDKDRRRMQFVLGKSTKSFTFDGQGRLVEERNVVTHRYSWVGGRLAQQEVSISSRRLARITYRYRCP